jgi:hypothetical protein
LERELQHTKYTLEVQPGVDPTLEDRILLHSGTSQRPKATIGKETKTGLPRRELSRQQPTI